MPLFTAGERSNAEALEIVLYGNPFSPERIAGERTALGSRFVEYETVWSMPESSMQISQRERPNVVALEALAESMIGDALKKLRAGVRANARDAELYESLVLYALYYRVYAATKALARGPASAQARDTAAGAFRTMRDDLEALLGRWNLPGLATPDAAHLFACFFQVVRAFESIFSTIVGATSAAGRLRGAIWQSIFTHDLRRYRRSLYDKTGDFTTLIIGPSGTGKELVARAIGAARYVPFDAKKMSFTHDVAGSFVPLNISALSPTLVESELFGHRRGAFTGAVENRKGWLQTCPPRGTVFLDEIGELDASIQVKLLRVLQSRTFERLGDTDTLTFHGKIIAATNRDLEAEMSRGRFRRDFYYRLCSDVIQTPSLRDLLEGSERELRRLVSFVARSLAPADADAITDETLAAIDRHVGPDYAWPGNFRELEQCVRNVIIRGEYRPALPSANANDDWLAGTRDASLRASDLIDAYCAHAYRIHGTYERAGEALGLDRRTIRAGVRRMSLDADSRA